MENCLLNYYILNDELQSSCDFNSLLLTEGPGIYEVIRVMDTKPLFLEEHLQRFFQSANHEGFDISIKSSDLKNRIKVLIEQNKLNTGNIRFQHIVHPEIGNTFLAWVLSNHFPAQKEFEEGVKITSVNAIRENPHSKRTNLPVRILAEKIIKTQKISEVLLINNDGLVTECSRSNIFFIRNNVLHTPSVDLVLQGITREKIINLAKNNRIDFVEENIKFSNIGQFDACFLSSTSKNVLPVREIDDRQFGVDDKITGTLILLFDKLVKTHLDSFRWDA